MCEYRYCSLKVNVGKCKVMDVERERDSICTVVVKNLEVVEK